MQKLYNLLERLPAPHTIGMPREISLIRYFDRTTKLQRNASALQSCLTLMPSALSASRLCGQLTATGLADLSGGQGPAWIEPTRSFVQFT